jgi:hypothetical protein
MLIPQKIFKAIIENLPNLYELNLSIGVLLGGNDTKLVELKFPARLEKLIWNCYQLNCDFDDPSNILPNETPLSNNNRYNLDISNYNIYNIKNLSWYSNYKSNINTLNVLLAKNHKLEVLVVNLDKLNFNSPTIISNNRNLTRLFIICMDNLVLNNSPFPKLLFIRKIELSIISEQRFESINQLLKSCSNLEEVHCYLQPDYSYIFQNILQLKNLKRLKICTLTLQYLLSAPFPNSNIEHLEFDIHAPFTGNLRLFGNLKQLKSVKFTGLHKIIKSYYDKSKLFFDHTNWREIEYSNSFQYWKI